MRQIILFLLLIAPGVASAQPDTSDELGKLEADLHGVLQEQQSVYQNYQMTKERRLMEVQEGSQPPVQNIYSTGIDAQWPSYDDAIRRQMEREQRIQQYTYDMKRLAARYLELESQRKALLERIRELTPPN